MWGALSDERMGLSFTIAAGARQRSHSRVRLPWGSYFTVSDPTLPFSSLPTSHRVTVEVFDPASTRESCSSFKLAPVYSRGTDHAAQKHTSRVRMRVYRHGADHI
jgi:hypothetical protein